MRSAALALVVAMAGAGAWTACGISDSATRASAAVDPGPTFGVEITVAIKGRGRVVSDPAALDCPSKCFARIVLADPTLDGSDLGLALTAQSTIGSHFAGWTYESLDLGVRARGPSQCSPMTRATTVLPVPSGAGAARVALHYGETTGTPPAGLETECAAFTTVPVAYALTATFEEDAVIPGPPPPSGPPIEVLFEPPALGTVVSREIGVMGGRVYWRFDRNGASGVASGRVDGQGGGSTVHVAPSDSIQKFHVGRQVVFQHGNPGGSGYVEVIQSGSLTRTNLGYMSPCMSLASDDLNAYCRVNFGGAGSSTYLAAFANGGGSWSYVYMLPPGNDLAVDDQQFYFSEDRGALLQGEAVVQSASRFPEGGVLGSPDASKLVFGQTSPRDLAVGPEYLFWLDDQGGNFVTATTAPKTGADGGSGLPRGVPGGRFLALDPTSATTFWLGVSNSLRPGDSYIVKASALSSSITSFRSGLTGLGGIAVDATHVFWTQNDGRVYRAPKD